MDLNLAGSLCTHFNSRISEEANFNQANPAKLSERCPNLTLVKAPVMKGHGGRSRGDSFSDIERFLGRQVSLYHCKCIYCKSGLQGTPRREDAL